MSAVPLADDPRVLRHLTVNSPAFDALRRQARDRRCGGCGRKTPFRKDGARIQHRTEPDNLTAPYCEGDTV